MFPTSTSIAYLRDLENNDAKMEDGLEDQVSFEIQLVPSAWSTLQPTKRDPLKDFPIINCSIPNLGLA